VLVEPLIPLSQPGARWQELWCGTFDAGSHQ
jgi:hypothetical protein